MYLTIFMVNKVYHKRQNWPEAHSSWWSAYQELHHYKCNTYNDDDELDILQSFFYATSLTDKQQYKKKQFRLRIDIDLLYISDMWMMWYINSKLITQPIVARTSVLRLSALRQLVSDLQGGPKKKTLHCRW